MSSISVFLTARIFRPLGALALVAPLLIAPVEALAQSNLCNQLAAQLAAANSGSGAAVSPRYRQYDDAVRQQRIQITKTQRIAKRAGCYRKTLFGATNRIGRCGRILDGIERMENNLAQLEEARQRYAPAGSSNERQRIIRRMKLEGCISGGNRQASTKPRKRRTLIEQIFGVRTYGDDGRRGVDDFGADLDLADRYGTYRTLCVRTCDGYYFPISFSTLPERFGIDEERCAAMCPGTDVSLYFHRMPAEDSEEMVSYPSQEPYAEKPFAFSYRKQVSPECRCRFSTANDVQNVDVENSAEAREADDLPRVGLPVFRQDPALDPDTRESRVARLSFERLALLMKGEQEDTELVAENQDGRRIRIVGPAFFPVQ